MCIAPQTTYPGCKCKRWSITPCKAVSREQRTIQRRFAKEVKDKKKDVEYDAPELEPDWPTGKDCSQFRITVRGLASEEKCPDCILKEEKIRYGYGTSNIDPDVAKRIRKLEFMARDAQPEWSDSEGEK
ncbi:hypothetical protein NCU16924 [Neurospora crassa OR74A]|uniref:Uncharacterized protein n=1 Tax=Neurospora crassa (strain ATCC 24698 / 74-OR23-1A / CBS 708.71 / DSM 1257 / FGSC 987) TaxID=367110 RepID=V5IL69_NEUCR|nr:hypothetical protein NCU16924 [Neurospora crassa OR74A]ESA42362.1 hypothetical protein NCU16924 [Neurospora crassa OR74A]|eukprot:XP_011394804.1 hypothetical protein NCU16924 [Neurospora crassa OR74A]